MVREALQVETLNPHDMADVLWSFATCQLPAVGIAQLPRLLPRCNPTEVAQIAWALTKLTVEMPSELLPEVRAKIHEFKGVGSSLDHWLWSYMLTD